MSVPFTSITTTLNWAALSFAVEWSAAFQERASVAGFVPLDPLWAGANLSSRHVFTAAVYPGGFTPGYGVQPLMRSICGAFVDPGNLPTAFTESSWKTYAGLHPSGYRRATTWPTDWTNLSDAAYSYGDMEEGDIIGPWVFDDLQKGMSALKCASSGWVWDQHTTLTNGALNPAIAAQWNAITALPDRPAADAVTYWYFTTSN